MAPPYQDMEKEVKLFLAGVPIAEIARMRGVSRQAMWRALRRRGCCYEFASPARREE